MDAQAALREARRLRLRRHEGHSRSSCPPGCRWGRSAPSRRSRAAPVTFAHE
jgi:hypothetical protein